MKIVKLPLTDSYFIIIFEGANQYSYSISKSSDCVLMNNQFIETAFQNSKQSVKNCKMLGKLSELTEEKAKSVFTAAELEAPYINYTDRSKTFDSALDSFKSFLEAENWDSRYTTWIIIPKPSKQLKGKTIIMEFEVGSLDFGHGESKMDLEIFMSAITRTTKSLKFSMKIPKFLYDQCMKDADIQQRPTQDYIEGDTIADLHIKIRFYVNQAHKIWETETSAKNAKKVICVYFNSSEKSTKDDYNFAYTGQQISTTFSFFVAYKPIVNNNGFELFTFKKLQSGMGTTQKGVKGIVDYEMLDKKNWIRRSGGVLIEWTQEREDFLTELESKFRGLSENLNSFLKDLNDEKLEKLIQNSEQLKLS